MIEPGRFELIENLDAACSELHQQPDTRPTSVGLAYCSRTRTVLFVLPKKAVAFGPIQGKVEKRETPLQAAVRELWEEAGVTVNPGQSVYLGSALYPAPAWKAGEYAWQLMHVHLVRLQEPRIGALEPKIEKAVWFHFDNLPWLLGLMSENKRLLVSDALRRAVEKKYIDFHPCLRHLFAPALHAAE